MRRLSGDSFLPGWRQARPSALCAGQPRECHIQPPEPEQQWDGRSQQGGAAPHNPICKGLAAGSPPSSMKLWIRSTAPEGDEDVLSKEQRHVVASGGMGGDAVTQRLGQGPRRWAARPSAIGASRRTVWAGSGPGWSGSRAEAHCPTTKYSMRMPRRRATHGKPPRPRMLAQAMLLQQRHHGQGITPPPPASERQGISRPAAQQGPGRHAHCPSCDQRDAITTSRRSSLVGKAQHDHRHAHQGPGKSSPSVNPGIGRQPQRGQGRGGA